MKSAILIIIKYERMQTFAFSLGDFKLLFVSYCMCKSNNKNLKASFYILQHSLSLNIFTVFFPTEQFEPDLYVLKALYKQFIQSLIKFTFMSPSSNALCH